MASAEPKTWQGSPVTVITVPISQMRNRGREGTVDRRSGRTLRPRPPGAQFVLPRQALRPCVTCLTLSLHLPEARVSAPGRAASVGLPAKQGLGPHVFIFSVWRCAHTVNADLNDPEAIFTRPPLPVTEVFPRQEEAGTGGKACRRQRPAAAAFARLSSRLRDARGTRILLPRVNKAVRLPETPTRRRGRVQSGVCVCDTSHQVVRWMSRENYTPLFGKTKVCKLPCGQPKAPTTGRERLHPCGFRTHFGRSAKEGALSPTLALGPGGPPAWSVAPVANL